MRALLAFDGAVLALAILTGHGEKSTAAEGDGRGRLNRRPGARRANLKRFCVLGRTSFTGRASTDCLVRGAREVGHSCG